MKLIDKISLTVVGVTFAAVTALNLFQPNRPTESALEQRKLAEMPTFTLSALADGSYFGGWSDFISDTFIGRDALVDMSKRFDSLLGIAYDMGDGGRFAILQTGTKDDSGPNQSDEDLLADAFAQLTTPPETTAPETTVPETTAPETTAPETTAPVDTETPPETEETTVAETEPPQTVDKINLSRNRMTLTIGSGSVVYAEVATSDGKGASVSWSISDKKIATIASNPGGGVNVKGVAEGECTLICKTKDGVRAECQVVVRTVAAGKADENDTADFLANGLFIYGDAVYTQAYYGEKAAKYYAQTAEYYKSLFGEDVNVSVAIAPVSSMVIENEEVAAKFSDQGDIQDKIGAQMSDNINFVDVYSEMYAHRDEYLFYKSDHHWTALGAYYAYRAFAESLGLEPTALSDLDYAVLNSAYHGSMYQMTKDIRVKGFVDVVEAYLTKKEHTMTVTTMSGYTANYNHCVVKNIGGYVSFIAGDNPYTVINVPENPQDKNILVLKDSFGDAFVPYLCEHFGNIIVVDVRYTDMNVYEQLGDYGLTDILFVNNVQAAMSSAWPRMYLKAVGITG